MGTIYVPLQTADQHMELIVPRHTLSIDIIKIRGYLSLLVLQYLIERDSRFTVDRHNEISAL